MLLFRCILYKCCPIVTWQWINNGPLIIIISSLLQCWKLEPYTVTTYTIYTFDCITCVCGGGCFPICFNGWTTFFEFLEKFPLCLLLLWLALRRPAATCRNHCAALFRLLGFLLPRLLSVLDVKTKFCIFIFLYIICSYQGFFMC